MSEEIFRDHIKAPEDIIFEDAICTAFVVEDKITEEVSIAELAFDSVMESFYNKKNVKLKNDSKELSIKNFEQSTQSQDELNDLQAITDFLDPKFEVQPTPYDPRLLMKLQELSPVHSKCVKVKVRDSVGRSYKIFSKYPISADEGDNTTTGTLTITEETFQEEVKRIKNFIDNCNSNEDFPEICYKVGLDKEGIGWGGFEVIRDGTGKVAKLMHIPGERIRTLKGFKGFIEIDDNSSLETRYTYYQPFGQKVGKWIPDPFDIRPVPRQVFRPYDPDEDGELRVGQNNLQFNLMDKRTGEPMKGRVSTNFKNAANELLFIPNTHNSTIYYGISDIISAIGAILVNNKILDFYHQFFDHNCIPRYVVIVRGAKVEDSFHKMLNDYFENKIKGSAHKTMILTLGGIGGNRAEVEFKALNEGIKDSNFDSLEKANDQKIMTAHGIPPAVLAINEAASLGSGKGNSQAELYKNRVILPLQLFWANKLNKLFRLGLGCKYARIEFDPMDIKDALQLAQSLNYLLTLGVLTINEARRQLGMDGNLKGGDVAFVRLREKSLIKVEDLPTLTAELEEMEDSEEPAKDIEI